MAVDHYERASSLDPDCPTAHYKYASYLKYDSDSEKARDHYEQALAIDPNYIDAYNNYVFILWYYFDMPEKAKEQYEQALAIASDPSIHRSYALLLLREFDAPEKAKPHLETALQGFQRMGNTGFKLRTLHALVHVHRSLDNEETALEYCEHAFACSDNEFVAVSWFKGVYTLLTETDSRTRYVQGLTAVCDEHRNLSEELFEVVWMNRDAHPPGSKSHDVALAAGIMLAALTRGDSDGSQRCEEILSRIEPPSLSSPIRILYKSLDGGPTDSLDVSSMDEPLENLPLETLERQAVAHLLDRSEH